MIGLWHIINRNAHTPCGRLFSTGKNACATPWRRGSSLFGGNIALAPLSSTARFREQNHGFPVLNTQNATVAARRERHFAKQSNARRAAAERSEATALP